MSEISTDDLTIERFEAGQVDAESFDHQAHVYMGWLYVGSYDLVTAITRFDEALRRLTAKLGVAEKYHATITWTFLVLIRERYRDAECWPDFLSRNPDLVNNSKQTLRRYYSDAVLFSKRARKQFVLPDNLAR